MDYYVYSGNEEDWSPDIESVIDQIDAEESDVVSIYKGEAVSAKLSEFIPQGWELIEWMQERAYDSYGEYAESFLDYVTTEKRDDLMNDINKVITEWFVKNQFTLDFYTVTNVKEIKVLNYEEV